MKLPKYFVQTAQDASDIGINPFALTLLAESFADDPNRFHGENVVLLGHAHNGVEVWFILTTTQPKESDFDGTALAPSADQPKEDLTIAERCAQIAECTQGVAIGPFEACGCGKIIAARIRELASTVNSASPDSEEKKESAE